MAGWQAGWATSNGQVAPAPIATRKASELLLKEFKKNSQAKCPTKCDSIDGLRKKTNNKVWGISAHGKWKKKKKNEALNENDWGGWLGEVGGWMDG